MIPLTRALTEEARRLGFELSGTCPAVETPNLSRLRQWLDRGYAGEMRYLPDRADAYAHPDHVLAGVKSILMLGMNYHVGSPDAAHERGNSETTGKIAAYARGSEDYHDVIHRRLRELASFLRRREPAARVRGVVDTAPLLEREFARLAGLGWIGKNTLLLNKRYGSWFFLAALLTDVELDYDQPFEADHCGTCRACLDVCPTDAFPQPYVLDATRCISYLTIELRSEVPEALREDLAGWAFGCDLCQEVCPWNGRVPTTAEQAFSPREDLDPLDLVSLFELDEQSFRDRFRGTPLWRARRRGMLRNAALLLGRRRSSAGIEALSRGLNDDDPLVRASSAWALGRYGATNAEAALTARRANETDPSVLRAIDVALGR